MSFKEGDWATVKLGTTWIVVVAEVGSTMAGVHLIRTLGDNGEHKPDMEKMAVFLSDMKPMRDTLTHSDFLDLMCLAVNTKDKKWFNELIGRMQQYVPRGNLSEDIIASKIKGFWRSVENDI